MRPTRAMVDPFGYESALNFLFQALTLDTNPEHPLRVGVLVQWHREATSFEMWTAAQRTQVSAAWDAEDVVLSPAERRFLVRNLIAPDSRMSGFEALHLLREVRRE